MATNDIQELIRASARRHNVDPDFALSIASTESSFNPQAIGKMTPYGQARGVFQLMPKTAQQYGVTDPFNPEQNVDAGVRYLADLQTEHKGDRRKMLIAYNSRRENVNKPDSELPGETQAYIKKIMGKQSGNPYGDEPVATGNPYGDEPFSPAALQTPGPARPPLPKGLRPGDPDSLEAYYRFDPRQRPGFQLTKAQQVGQDLLSAAAGFKGAEMATGRIEGPRTAPRYGEPTFPAKPGPVRQAAAQARESIRALPPPEGPKPVEPIKPDEAALRAQREARKARLQKEMPPPAEAKATKESAPPPAKKEPATGSDIYRQKGQMHGSHIERATIAKDANIGRFLKSKGFTRDMLDKMGEAEWKTTIQEVNKAYGTNYETKTRSLQSLMKRVGEIKNHLKEAPAGTAFPKTSLLRAPDGTTKEVPAEDVEHYLSRGATRA